MALDKDLPMIASNLSHDIFGKIEIKERYL